LDTRGLANIGTPKQLFPESFDYRVVLQVRLMILKASQSVAGHRWPFCWGHPLWDSFCLERLSGR